MPRSFRSAFTLIELLISTTIFVLTITSLITIFIAITRVQVRQSGVAEVNQQGQFLLQQIQYYIQNARLVDMAADAATSTLKLREAASSSVDPTYLYASSSMLYLQQSDSGTPSPLNSGKVSISNLSFTRHYQIASSSAFGTESVSYSFTVSASSGIAGQNFSQTLQSVASILAPVPQIALLQKVMGENNNSNISGVSSTYSGANTSGSLLLAVVSNQGAPINPTITDTQGNSWTNVAQATRSGSINNAINVFAVTSAKNGTNTVTAAFSTSSASKASIFLYEYRWSNPVSPPYNYSFQIQSNSSTPSSGSVSPGGNVELLLGVGAYDSLIDIWTAGPGYAIESSSTVSDTLVEDRVAFVTAPVDASWTINNLRTTLDLVVAISNPHTGSMGTWTATTPLPMAPGGIAAVMNNGYVYAIDSAATDECTALDNTTTTVYYGPLSSNGTISSWATAAQLPIMYRDEPFVIYNNYAYIVGGYQEQNPFQATSTVLYASINTDGTFGSWAKTTQLPVPLQAHSSLAYNGYLYSMGGRGWNIPSPTTDTSTVFYAQINSNGTLGSWNMTTPLLAKDSWFGAAAYNGYIYQVGGYFNGNPSTTINYAQINGTGSLGAWAATTNQPAIDEKNAEIANNGYIYQVAGVNGHTSPPTSTVLYSNINATGSFGSWVQTTPLPSALQKNGVIVYSGYLFSLGGNISLTDGCTGTSAVFSTKVN